MEYADVRALVNDMLEAERISRYRETERLERDVADLTTALYTLANNLGYYIERQAGVRVVNYANPTPAGLTGQYYPPVGRGPEAYPMDVNSTGR